MAGALRSGAMDLLFNVIYTPGTVAVLRPFAWSLVHQSQCRVRLVANGLPAPEERLLKAYARRHDRMEFFRYPSKKTAEHGEVLNVLVDLDPSDWFAFVDSDIFAIGDVEAELRPWMERSAVVLSGSPIWATATDRVAPEGASVLAGPQERTARDARCGVSYFGVYPKPILKRVMAETGVRFDKVIGWDSVPAAHRARLEQAGARADHYETGKLLNLLLHQAGVELDTVDLASVRHVGGLSLQARKRQNHQEWDTDQPAPPDRPWLRRKQHTCNHVSAWVQAASFGERHEGPLLVTEPDVRARIEETCEHLLPLYQSAWRGAEPEPRPASWTAALKSRWLESARPVSTRGLFVLGMHRSGTSCLIGLLETCGLFVGNVARENKHNAKGNLEDEGVREANKKLLLAAGATWDYPHPSSDSSGTNSAVTPSHDKQVRAALEPFRKHPRWAIKDPRMLLFLDTWRAHSRHHDLVGTFRHPLAVAGSLARRSGMPIDHGVRLWCRYNRELVAAHQREAFPLIDFDLDGEAYLAAFARLCDRLELRYDDERARRAFGEDLISQPKAGLGDPGGEAGEIYGYLKAHALGA